MPQSSNMKPVAAAVLVIAAILTATWWSARQRSDATEAAAAVMADPATGTMGPETAAAPPAMRDIWAGRARPPRPSAGNGPRRFLSGTPEQQARAREQYARLAEDLERAHAQQPVDAAWKGPTEATLSTLSGDEALQASGIAPESVSTDCRSSSCRITAGFGNTSDAQDWATLYTAMTGKNFRKVRYVTAPQPDGSVEVRIYGSRR